MTDTDWYVGLMIEKDSDLKIKSVTVQKPRGSPLTLLSDRTEGLCPMFCPDYQRTILIEK